MRGAPFASTSAVARLLWAGLGVLWLGVFALRVGYPYHFEWLESHVLCQALRFAQGFPLYEDPALGLPAHPYGPLYYVLLGGLLKIADPSLLPARAISQVATLCIALCVWKFARKNGAAHRNAVIAPLAWFAFFPACGAWYDLARVDMLGLALWSCGLVLVSDAGFRSRHWWAAILVFTFAGLAKQSCLPLALCAWLCSYRERNLRAQCAGALATAGLTIGAYFAIDLLLDGRLLYYAWTLPASHPQSWAHAALLFVQPALPLALVGCAFLLLGIFGGISRRYGFLWLLCAGFTTWTVTKQGAFLNHYLPLAVLGAMLMPLAFQALSSPRRTPWLQVLVSLSLLGAGLAAVVSTSPLRHVPTRTDREAGDAWVAWLRRSDVEVRMPGFTYLPVLAGMPIRAHEMAAIEVFDDWARRLAATSDPKRAAERMAAQPDLRFLFTAEPTVVVLAGDRAETRGLSFFGPLLESTGTLRLEHLWPYRDGETFRARSGATLRPEAIYVFPSHATVDLPPLPSR